MSNRSSVDFEVEDAEDFDLKFATGAFGGLNPNDGRIIFYVDRIETEGIEGQPGKERMSKVVRERQVEVHMTPHVWKSLAQWMMQHVKKYEDKMGEIQMPTDEEAQLGSTPPAYG